MRSKTTERFWRLFTGLPADVQRQVRVAYQLFRQNPRHSSLQFKRISPSDSSLYSARVGAHYRALCIVESDTATWFWVGSHEEYNTRIRRL